MAQNDTTPDGRPVVIKNTAPSGTFASLALPQFRLLSVGTGAAQVANWMETVARGWLVHSLTGSPLHLSLIAFAYGVSSLVASPIAGVMTDRLDRRGLAVATQFTSGCIALVIGVLVFSGHIQLWEVYLMAILSGVSAAVNMPARQVLVYDVVGTRYLTNAIALNSVIANVARIGAPTFAGVMIGTFGIGQSYFAEAAFFLLATIATFALQIERPIDRVPVPMWEGVRGGFDYVRRDPVLVRLVLLNAVPSVLIYPYVSLMPYFASNVLNTGATGFGFLLTGVGFGSIPGGLLIANMSRHKGRIMGIAALGYMGLVACFAYSELFYLSFAILVFAGVGWSMMAIFLNQILLQLQIEDDAVRGRVLALYTMSNGLTPFGNLAMGFTAGAAGVQNAVAVFALAGCVLAGYIGLGSKSIREL